MYREPHLQCKSDECRDLWLVWKELWDRDNDSKEAKEARKKWGKCVTEFGEMGTVYYVPGFQDLEIRCFSSYFFLSYLPKKQK